MGITNMKIMRTPVPIGDIHFTVYERLDRFWRMNAVWWVLRVVPRSVKYYVVVQAAVKNEQGNPGEVTATEMLKKYEKKVI